MVSPELERPLRSEEEARADGLCCQAFMEAAAAQAILRDSDKSERALEAAAEMLRRASEHVHRARLARGHMSERISLDVRGNEGDR